MKEEDIKIVIKNLVFKITDLYSSEELCGKKFEGTFLPNNSSAVAIFHEVEPSNIYNSRIFTFDIEEFIVSFKKSILRYATIFNEIKKKKCLFIYTYSSSNGKTYAVYSTTDDIKNDFIKKEKLSGKKAIDYFREKFPHSCNLAEFNEFLILEEDSISELNKNINEYSTKDYSPIGNIQFLNNKYIQQLKYEHKV